MVVQQGYRLHGPGRGPANTVVVHGGPGAPGSAVGMAQILAETRDVLEPFQTAMTLEGQIQELHSMLLERAALPVTLVGHSWGAMLSFLVAARYPGSVRKLILVASGVFSEAHAGEIMNTRMQRLSPEKKAEAESLLQRMHEPGQTDPNEVMRGFGRLMTEADCFLPLSLDTGCLEYRLDQFQSVWPEMREHRASGALLSQGKSIRCPVVAMHGDYDPHPVPGIRDPLQGVVKDFRMQVLKDCGHYPWLERRARDAFCELMQEEIGVERTT